MSRSDDDDRRTQGPRYVAAAGLRVLDFGDQCAVFDPVSWDVHLLNPAAIGALELFAAEPRSIVDVEAFLVDALQDDERGRAHEHAGRVTAELVSLGLIRSVHE